MMKDQPSLKPLRGYGMAMATSPIKTFIRALGNHGRLWHIQAAKYARCISNYSPTWRMPETDKPELTVNHLTTPVTFIFD